MSRIRTIKPDFFLNDSMADLPPLDRILFIGLWTQADREGRLEDRSRKIKAAILPYDDHDVDVALTRLQEKTFIKRYTIKECNYIQINNFLKHQYPNIKEQISTIPAPSLHGTSTPRLRKGTIKGKEGKGTIEKVLILPEWLPLEEYNSFIEMRTKLNKKPTENAKELLIKKLDKLRQEGNDPKQVLQESIMNSWQGIFPLKHQKGENYGRNFGDHKKEDGESGSGGGKYSGIGTTIEV